MGVAHLWLGFASGIVVFIVSVTGCLYAFQSEIQGMLQPYRDIEVQNKPFLPPSELKAIALKALPGKHLHAVQYETPDRAAYAIFYAAEPAHYYNVYMNPYTGEVLKVKNMHADFFYQVLQGHYALWLPYATGHVIVSCATLIFVVMLISGLVLWWPKKGKAKQRFRVKWNARWRRKNYDLHNVLGFYMTWVAIILAITGLVWGFQWVNKGIYWLAGGDKPAGYVEPVSTIPTTAVTHDTPAPDAVWLEMNRRFPQAARIEIHFAETDSSVIAANANVSRKTYWQVDYHFFDQYTREEIPVNQVWGSFADATGADKLMRMNYDIHTGTILGLPGKLLVFFASLIAASLPVTGFLIWHGRRKKAKQDAARPADYKRNRIPKPAVVVRPVNKQEEVPA